MNSRGYCIDNRFIEVNKTNITVVKPEGMISNITNIYVAQYDENKKFIANNYELRPVQNINTNEIFPTAKDAAASLGKSTSRFIIACCRGINKTAYGYKWKFIDNFE